MAVLPQTHQPLSAGEYRRQNMPTYQPPKTDVWQGAAHVGAGTPLAAQQQQNNQHLMNQNAQNNMIAAGNRFGDMMTGQPFDVYGLRNNDAMARNEMNQRSITAHRIQQAGFAGTPLGAMAGNAMETQMARDRFSNNLNIEAERQNMMTEGARLAAEHADGVNRFDAARTAIDQEKRNITGDNFHTYLGTHPGLVDAMLNAGNPVALQTLIENDPGLHRVLTELHKREGGDGNFTAEWARGKVENWNSSTSQSKVIMRTLTELGVPEDMARNIVAIGIGEAIGYQFTFDKDGVLQVVKTEGDAKAKADVEAKTDAPARAAPILPPRGVSVAQKLDRL